MRNKSKLLITILAIISLIILILVLGCVSPPLEEKKLVPKEITPTPTLTPAPESSPIIKITDMFWDSNMKIIEITLNKFPSTWDNWIMYIDGKEMPMEGGPGNPVVRPNAPLDKPPTGLIIGALPWVNPLTEANFPCCGVIQFYILGEGLTNEYEFKLIDFGCKTASKKECPSEWIKHHGDLVIGGTETKIIEDVKYFQQGNIYVNDKAKLIIRNSQLMIGPGEVVPTVHRYIFVDDEASLEIENSIVFPEDGLVVIETNGKVDITNSPTKIHIVSINEGAKVTITDSEVVNPIGGLIEVHGGDTAIINSTIGAVSMEIPAKSRGKIRGLKSGVYLESWDVHRDLGISNIPYNLTLENVHILKDTLPPGGFERGWVFEINPEAEVKISDSELRKVFIFFKNEKINIENLKMGIPSSFKYKEIELDNVIVRGEWGIFLGPDVADATIKSSESLFILPTGQTNINLIDSHMMEFIPTNFFGTLNFENCIWRDEGEIIGGTPYHSMVNNFTIKGSLKIGPELRNNLKWKDAQVTREYDVIVRDESGNPIEGALIKIGGKTFVSDNAGKVKFSLILNEFNYNKPKKLEVFGENNFIVQKEIDFFTETPVIIIRD